MDFGGYEAFEESELGFEFETPTLPVDIGATTAAAMKTWPRAHRGLASLVTQAQRSYASLLKQGARGFIGTAAGHSNQRVVVLVPPNFDPSRPFDVRVHYHGMWSTASRPAADATLPARIWPQMNKPQPSVFVFPFAVMVDHKTGGKASMPRWSAAKQSRQTALEGLQLAGIRANPARVIVSGHSAGGYAMQSLYANGGLDCDVLVLEDCLYGGVKSDVVAWGKTALGQKCRHVISFRGTNSTWMCPADLPNQQLVHVCGKNHYTYALLDVDGAWPRCACPAPKPKPKKASAAKRELEFEAYEADELEQEAPVAMVARSAMTPFVHANVPVSVATALSLIKLTALYFEVPWPLVFATFEHEGGLTYRTHDDGVMQTIDDSRTSALKKIPLELKRALVADASLSGTALDQRLLQTFHDATRPSRQLATQIAFGTAELKSWLDRYERYVALGWAAYNTGSGPKPWVAAQTPATAARAEKCRKVASAYHQPVSAIRIAEGFWLCDPQMKGSGWAWRAKVLDAGTTRSIRGYQYLRSVASKCPTPPTVKCTDKTQREPCSKPLSNKGTRPGVLDKLFRPTLMRADYYRAVAAQWPQLADDGRPLRAAGSQLVADAKAAWQ